VARRAIENAVRGAPDMAQDPRVHERRGELVAEARIVLAAICDLAGEDVSDPLTDPATLARAVTSGMLDAPQLKNNRFGRGHAVTTIDSRGACVAVDPRTGRVWTERERLAALPPEWEA
jgi:hypothetical protein